jgi:hypothetical protein
VKGSNFLVTGKQNFIPFTPLRDVVSIAFLFQFVFFVDEQKLKITIKLSPLYCAGYEN